MNLQRMVFPSSVYSNKGSFRSLLDDIVCSHVVVSGNTELLRHIVNLCSTSGHARTHHHNQTLSQLLDG